MGILIKLLIVLVIIALAAPFFIKGQDGRPLVSLEDMQKPDALGNYAESLGEMTGSMTGVTEDAGKTPANSAARVYSWRDEQGNVHYSNIPPNDEAAVETVKVNPNINVISIDKTNEQARLPVPLPETEESPDIDPGMIRTYTPETQSR